MKRTCWRRRRSNEAWSWLPPPPRIMVEKPRRRQPTEEDYFADSEMANDRDEPRQRRYAEPGPPDGCILNEFPHTSRSRTVVGIVGLLLVFILYQLFFA
ncbi:hypothetical protein HPB52_001313 [Rhipicephalus sanguineus]|uniref:Uncharacterized protein n=1 Tax=Rhipicephalus sanguineus TaxID=34632 RepID=A0A9D4PYA0_RHISA|nr:hypothetical protein HPB52_001313 [Rhipicephalus sanguineus]